MLLSEMDYAHLRRERGERVQLAMMAYEHAWHMAQRCYRKGDGLAGAAWVQVYSVRRRTIHRLRLRGGLPRQGAPR